MSLVERFASGALWSALGNVAQLALAFATLAITARFVGPEAFGVFALAWIAIGFGEVLVNGSFGESLIQRRDLSPEHTHSTFWLMVLLGLLAWFATASLAPSLAALFSSPALAAILPWRALSLPMAALVTVPQALVTRSMRMRALALAETAAVAVAGIAGVTLAILGHGVWALVATDLVRGAVRLVLLTAVSGYRPRFVVSLAHLRELTGFNLSIIGSRLLTWLDLMIPRAAIGFALGEAALGFFTIGWRLYEYLAAALINPIQTIAMPATAKVQDDLPALRRLFGAVIQVSAFIAYPAFLGFAAVAPLFVPLVFGEAWAPGTLTVQILVLMGMRMAVAGNNSAVLRGVGRADLMLAMLAVGAVFGLLTVPFAAMHSIEAVAAVVLLRSFVTWPVGAWFVERATGFPARQQYLAGWRSLLGSFATAATAFTVCEWLQPSLPASIVLPAAVGAGLVVYLACTAALAPQMARATVALGRSLLRREPGALRNALARFEPAG